MPCKIIIDIFLSVLVIKHILHCICSQRLYLLSALIWVMMTAVHYPARACLHCHLSADRKDTRGQWALVVYLKWMRRNWLPCQSVNSTGDYRVVPKMKFYASNRSAGHLRTEVMPRTAAPNACTKDLNLKRRMAACRVNSIALGSRLLNLHRKETFTSTSVT